MNEVLLYLLGIVIMLLGLAVSIGLHEIGHLVPAKLFGVKVTQYMIGFGKTLWSRRRGETEYGVKMIPLGGYIAMTGMYPPATSGEGARSGGTGFLSTLVNDARQASVDTVVAGEERRTFYRLPVWKRVIIMLGGPLMNLILAGVFFSIVLVGFGLPQYSTVLAQISECVLPSGSERSECTSEDPAAPAAAAGLKPGDRIVAIDGVEIREWEQLRSIVSAAPNRQLRVDIARGEPLETSAEHGGATQTVTLIPAATERLLLDGQGERVLDEHGMPRTETVGIIGVIPSTEVVRQAITSVPAFVGENVARVAQVIIGLPQRMVDVWQAAFGSEDRDANGPIGVVGVGRLAGEIVSLDEAPVAARAQVMLSLLGSLNVALFVFNLVPLLPLDGGHVAGALYEGVKRGWARVRRRPDPGPVDTARMVPVTFAVVIVLGAMSLLLAYADIVKPVSLFG